ncbi:unnamed protein product [Hydatigera taeniaeformis]|uniref:Uncharacterized protein n=1 Tax=Hydatigena taeniaeformis TaxID=6205 RepID=A0A0R3XD55_HYDTA|nr:unnamed protein product [Hydatigera taeniaeformis]
MEMSLMRTRTRSFHYLYKQGRTVVRGLSQHIHSSTSHGNLVALIEFPLSRGGGESPFVFDVNVYTRRWFATLVNVLTRKYNVQSTEGEANVSEVHWHARARV